MFAQLSRRETQELSTRLHHASGKTFRLATYLRSLHDYPESERMTAMAEEIWTIGEMAYKASRP